MKVMLINGKAIPAKNPSVVVDGAALNIYDGNEIIGQVWRPKSWIIFDDSGKAESQFPTKITDEDTLRDARLLARLNNLIAQMLMTEVGKIGPRG